MADQPSPRRLFQFRLRTLMIGVALVAVLAAIVARLARPNPNHAIAGKWVCKINGHPFKADFTINGRVVLGPDGVPGPDAYGGGYTFNPEDRTIKLHLLVDRGGPGDLERVDEDAHLTKDGVLILDTENLRLTRPP